MSNTKRPKIDRARPAMKVVLGGVTSLLVLGSLSAAEAAVPASDGVISACFAKSDGNVRIIDTAKTTRCRAGETLITWNQTGPVGPQGPRGIQA